MNRVAPFGRQNQEVDKKQSGGDRGQPSPPAISLPKGGGAIRGIDEKFSVNPATGTGSLTVPIFASPSRSDFSPQLSLSYDSGAGNGPCGVGWRSPIPSVTRKTDKGLPQYRDAEDSDTFILSGAEDLVPVLVQQGGQWVREVLQGAEYGEYKVEHYRPRIEGLFARIERWEDKQTGDVHWRAVTKDNVTSVYGQTANARIFDPQDDSRVFSWLLELSYDDRGNLILYEYKRENSDNVARTIPQERNRLRNGNGYTNLYLKRIKYGNRHPYERGARFYEVPVGNAHEPWLFEVVFDYGEHDAVTPTPDEVRTWPIRPDPFSSYRAGFEIRTQRLCQRVLMFHHFAELGETPCLVRSTDFRYLDPTRGYEPDPVGTYLVSVQQTGYVRQPDGVTYRKKSLPPLELDYSRFTLHQEVQFVEAESLEHLPVGIDDRRYQWVDLDGEGISGVLTEKTESWFYKRNLSRVEVTPTQEVVHTIKFAPVSLVAPYPSLAELQSGQQQILDLAGDGKKDLVLLAEPVTGFYERDPENGWAELTPFRSSPRVSWGDPNLRFVDLNGDGHSDILITEDHVFTWYPSLAEEGFGAAVKVPKPTDEEEGPALVFADATQSVYLADMSGDGLADIVRIRNGEVCYWPNLGYGRFGAKVSMDKAPFFDSPDLFDQSRIRLADIDGSGTTDIIYLGGDTISIWRNQAGNAWSDPDKLTNFPRIDNLSSVSVVDFFGNGTACLVWSSPLPADTHQPMAFIDLMGGVKPHLLVSIRNNLGAETRLQYASSTKFYLQDLEAGTPWITRMPFPVHVVEKVTVKDKWRKTSFSTTYSYHHGYFDGHEREFRGFGRVDQIDVESFGTFAAGNADSPYITDDRTLYQPPVKTVTWFHTGAFLHWELILSQYRDEYFPNWFEALDPSATNVLGTFRENALPEPDIDPRELTPDEWRQAMRACKGMMLRQEIYELDVDALERGEERPVKLFSTSYHNCHIRMLQPQAGNLHAVFLVTESEAITYHYELDLRPETLTPDPRIAHTLNLNVDEYGNVLQAVAVVYPRVGRHEDPALPPGAEALIAQVQTETHLAYTETRHTNDVNDPAAPDNYRLRVPCEVLTYELTGIGPEDDDDRTTADPRDNRYFTLNELRRFRLSLEHQRSGESVAAIAYHEIPNRSTPQKRLVEHVRILYFDENLRDPLSLGVVNSLGLPFETYKLALTEDLLNAVFADKLTTEVRGDLEDADTSGYLSGTDLAARFRGTDTGGQYWLRSGIAGFASDAADHFYLPERYTDSFGEITTLQYDARDLYIASSTDPVRNTVTVTQFDYRVLAPREMEDINGNFSEVAFDVLGLPAAMAAKGKGTEGDHLDDLTADILHPESRERAAFFADPYDEDEAHRVLGSATARHLYYFGEEINADGLSVTWGVHPPCAAAILRERHVAALSAGERSDLQVAFEYSDGMGSVLVKKVQAEPEVAGGPLRWIANGKTILNNKGKPVKQYEPYFSESEHRFEEPREVGVTPVMYHDAVGRVVRTELPDGAFSRAEFSPWHVSTSDPGDTAFDPESGLRSDWDRRRMDPSHPRFAEFGTVENQAAARLAEHHANTPATVFLDSLGREVVSVAHNKTPSNETVWRNTPILDRPWVDDKYLTFTKLDAEGKPLWIRDARGNLVMQYITPPVPNNQPADPASGFVPCYDIAGNLLFQHSMDAGDRWMINDAAGQPFYAWDLNTRIDDAGDTLTEHRLFHTRYDALRRPLEQRLSVNTDSDWHGTDWQVVQRFVYGEGQADDQAHNLRGQLYRHYDPSGRVTNPDYDFKGNLLTTQRRLVLDYRASVIHWPESLPEAEAALETEIFTQRTEYDALNRMTRLFNWYRSDNRVTVYEPHYSARGLLESEVLHIGAARQPDGTHTGGQRTEAVHEIRYDAKGQRQHMLLGNGTRTRYHYDPETFRLVQLRTTRPGAYDPRFPEYHSGLADDSVIQQLNHTYDAVGNITETYDEAYEPVFFRNQRVEPHSRYVYDALYRLIEASGRENASAMGPPPQREDAAVASFPLSPGALRNYSQSYFYDSAGNIQRMQHRASGGSWTRDYDYAANSNRLLSTWTGDDRTTAVDYGYDIHGSMLNLNRTPEEYRLRWDYRDMIHHVNLGGGGRAWYNYDAGKQRTRKGITNTAGDKQWERFYLGGMEVYRHYGTGGVVEEIETHHLFADDQRVLIVEDVLRTDRTELGTRTLYRYQLGNHLGSACVELDEASAVISYEEYHPYGTTAYQAGRSAIEVSLKRYRYTGMERDEETGLSYHTARYYATWLGRWCNADPSGLEGGLNLYEYSFNNPINYSDKSGLQPPTRAVTMAQGLRNSNEPILTPNEMEEHRFQQRISLDQVGGRTWIRGVTLGEFRQIQDFTRREAGDYSGQIDPREHMVSILTTEGRVYNLGLDDAGTLEWHRDRATEDLIRTSEQMEPLDTAVTGVAIMAGATLAFAEVGVANIARAYLQAAAAETGALSISFVGQLAQIDTEVLMALTLVGGALLSRGLRTSRRGPTARARATANRRGQAVQQHTPVAASTVPNITGRGWRTGDPHWATVNGVEPKWAAVRYRYWRNRWTQARSTGEFSGTDLARMRRGRAPRDPHNPRRSRELEHVTPQRSGDPMRHRDLLEVTRLEHSFFDRYVRISDPNGRAFRTSIRTDAR